MCSPLNCTGVKLARFQETGNTIYELMEFVAFYLFFKECLEDERLKRIYKIFFVLFLFVVLLFLPALVLLDNTKDQVYQHSFFINVIEFLFLSAMCMGYYYELFTTMPKSNLFNRPSFFIVTTTVLLLYFTNSILYACKEYIFHGNKNVHHTG